MLTSFSYFDLIESFPKRGCVVCNLLLRDVDRLLDSILYEYVNDPETQKTFRASRGLCNEHGRQMAKLDNVLGIAVLYEAAVDEVLSILDHTVPDGNVQHGLARLLFPQDSNAALVEALEPTQPCIACKMVSASEAQYISILSEHIADEKMQEAYRTSDGLCLEHFRQALRQTHNLERSRLLVEIQRKIWDDLRGELREFMRKYDFKHADEKMGTEGDSWRRAIARLGGEAGVFGVRRAIP